MSWYQIRAEADRAEILLYDRIGESVFEDSISAKSFLQELRALNAKAIALRINSPGGSVPDGMAIHQAVSEHPARVTVHIDGLAASIASVIAMAGDDIHMAPGALLMIHNPHALAEGDARQMRATADLLDKVRGQMVDVYASHSEWDSEQIGAAMDAETWLTADEALSAGFVDSIAGARVAAHHDLSQFRNPPTMEAAMNETEEREPETAPDIPALTNEAPAPVRLDIRPRATGTPTLAEYVIAAAKNDAPVLAEYARRIRAAAPHTLSTDIPGLIPTPIVTPVVEMRDAQAPLFNSLGPNAAPAGKNFTIPKITTHLADAAEAAEKTDVTSQLVVGDVDVTMHFIKRAANISYEAVQYSNPGVVGIAASDLVDAVLRGAENVTVAGIEAATGTNPAVAVDASGSDAWAVLSAAVSVFYGATGQMPSHFATAPDVWAALAGMTNIQGTPLINGVSQNLNGSWGTLFGVPVVVSPAMTAGKAFLISEYGVKTWASSPVNLQVSQPTTFAYELGGGRNVGVSIADGKFLTPISIAPVLPLAAAKK